MNDQSMPRRAFRGPALFSMGFRPLFLLAAVFAALAVPLWAGILLGHVHGLPLMADPLRWHAHEMVFGYTGAVIGGFLLTAVPNWTGRLPIRGWPLFGLVILWLAGRVGIALETSGILTPLAGTVADMLFITALLLAVLREVVAGRNWRNLPVVLILAVFGAANLISNIAETHNLDPRLGERLGLAAIACAMTLIGGRIVPSFTRNWLMKAKGEPYPAPFDNLDRLAILLTVTAIFAWAFYDEAMASGVLLALAGLAQAIRLGRWYGARTMAEPLVAILHIGYGWLVLALFALSAAILLPGAMAAMPALHALTAGAIGVMTLAVMTRAILGHTGRPLRADFTTLLIFTLVNIGALWRVAAGWLPFDYFHMAAMSGLVWSAAFLLFAVKYGYYLVTRRPD